MVQGPASIKVAGTTFPFSSNIWDIPSFKPNINFMMNNFQPSFRYAELGLKKNWAIAQFFRQLIYFTKLFKFWEVLNP
jgi:hypothetical protein